jgi:hypothetical protein
VYHCEPPTPYARDAGFSSIICPPRTSVNERAPGAIVNTLMTLFRDVAESSRISFVSSVLAFVAWIAEGGARMARRDQGECSAYSNEEERRSPGCAPANHVTNDRAEQ